MSQERLFNILGQIDENLVERADVQKATKSKKSIFLKFGTIAACALLAICIVMYQNNKPPMIDVPSTPGDNSELPLITIDFDYGSMGFEGYCAYTIDELVDDNPWNENSKITHLPVMKNALTYNGIYGVENPDIEAMKALLKTAASKLGMDAEHLEITDDTPDEETRDKITEKLKVAGGEVPDGYFNASRVFMTDQNIKVEVDSAMVVTVHFEPAVVLPEEFNFTHFAPYNDVYKVAAFLMEEYKEYIDIDNPKISIQGGNYNVHGDQKYDITFFDDTGDETQRILNYNFNYVTFACNDKGKLFISRVYHPDLTNVIGNYPIISKEKALELLENKNYITTVPEEFPGIEYVRKVEVIYRNGSREKTYMPYYCIYVELPSMKLENGLNTYGAYYVPAIEDKYIKNMPTWNGEFN